MQQTFDLEKPLFMFSENGNKLPFSIGDSITGVAIFGATGSGKTSGPGAFLAKKYLSAGYGGCVLTTKPDEKDLWVKYCRETGRLRDLVVIEPGGSSFFDFLSYEASHSKESSYTQNIAETLKVVIRASNDKDMGNSQEAFWQNAIDQLVFSTIELCLLAYGRLSVQQMYQIALSAPQKGQTIAPGQPKSAFARAFELAEESVTGQTFQYIDGLDRFNKELIKKPGHFEPMVFANVPDIMRLKSVDQFFNETYRNLAEKTRSIVSMYWTGYLFTLLQEPIYSLFCRNPSTVTPDDCRNGKIILLNLPVKMYHKAGRNVQILFKYIWQKAMERQKSMVNVRPVFMFIDEAQNFLHEYDSEFLSTSRSSLIANVYLSQNLPNYYAMMGGDNHKSEYRIKSMLGNFSTKIFCCNTCTETNLWASEMIGDGYTETTSRDVTVSGNFSSSRSMSYELEPMVRPELFGLLRQGGPKNGLIVETYVHRQGELFDNGHNFKKVIFNQK